MRDVRVAPTNDRSVVGVMNEFAFHGEGHFGDGLRDLRALSLRMASMPLGPLRQRSGFPDRELAGCSAMMRAPRRSSRFPGIASTRLPRLCLCLCLCLCLYLCLCRQGVEACSS